MRSPIKESTEKNKEINENTFVNNDITNLENLEKNLAADNLESKKSKKKGKKKRTLNELLTKINIEKNYLNFPSNIDNLRSSKEELFKALAEEIRERDEKEPKK